MTRDVSFDVVANDKSEAGLSSAERKFKATNDRIKREGEKSGADLGKVIGTGLGKGAADGLAKVPGLAAQAGKTAGPLLAAGLIAGLPLLGAAISAGIIGGAGIGGVVGGVALVAKDARVTAAGHQLADNLMGPLRDSAADSFVDPLLRQLDKVEARFAQWGPRFDRIFANSADFLDPLVDGALEGVDGILTGIDRLIEEGGPVIEAFGRLFANTGDSIGEAFSTISGGAEDAAAGVDFLSTVVGESIVIFGRVVRILTETWGALVAWRDVLLDLFPFLDFLDMKQERIGGSGTFAAEGANAAAGGFRAQSEAAVDLTASLERAEQAVRDVYQANLDLYSSETQVAEAMQTATKTIRDNGRTLALNSEKGRENRDALANVAGALQRNYDAYVKVNGVTPEAAALAGRLRGQFVSLARQAGYSAKEAQNLASRLLNIPTKRDTTVRAHTAEAKADIAAVKQRLNEVRNKTVTLTVNVHAPRLNKVTNQLDRAGANRFSADAYWAAVDGSNGATVRTGGPTPVSLTNEVSVNLDGRPFYSAAVRAAEQTAARQAWRQKVGPR